MIARTCARAARLLGAAWMLTASAAAAQQFDQACRDPAIGCRQGLSAECLRLGAGVVSADADCSAQMARYSDCLAYVAEHCPAGTQGGDQGAAASAPAPQPAAPAPSGRLDRAALEALAPPGHRIVDESEVGGARQLYVLANAPLGWAEAAQIADRMGGQLVVIDTASKNDGLYRVLVRHPELFVPTPILLAGTFSFGPFIGLYQQPGAAEPAGGWRWVDGRPVGYSKWMGGQPDNFFSVEHVGHFNCVNRATCDTWNDVKAEVEGVRSYIVEIPPR